MLSNLFQERVLPTPQPPDCAKDSEAADQSGEASSGGDNNEREDPTDREIVDILLAADLGRTFFNIFHLRSLDILFMLSEGEMGQEDYEDLYDEDERLYTGDGTNPNLVTKPKKKLELRAGLLREILSNKPKRHTFSGLYL